LTLGKDLFSGSGWLHPASRPLHAGGIPFEPGGLISGLRGVIWREAGDGRLC
jgi:hypothetical protein